MASKSLSYDVHTIDKIVDAETGYEIHHDKCWAFILDKKHGIVPRLGDVVEVYGGFGHQIRGVCINGITAFFKGDVQLNREHEAWKAATRARHEAEHKQLMAKIGGESPRKTVDVSGFGSGYEYCCQKMIEAGEAWLKGRPAFEFKKDLDKELEAVLEKASDNQCSGAQFGCVVSHLAFIHQNGRAAWLEKFAARVYELPAGLPAPAF